MAKGRQRLAPIRDELLAYAGRRRIRASRLLLRLDIMVLMEAGIDPSRGAWFFGCSLASIHRWARVAEDQAQLLDKQRAGRPVQLDEATQLKLIAFYCQSPLPGCRGWSFRWAARYLSEHVEILGRTVSSSTVHRVLAGHGLRPHRVRYFLHVTDPLFFPKMERLVRLYTAPPPFLFCLDECTGLQALARVAVEMKTDHGVKIEFEYQRRGTRDLYAVLDVGSGRVFARCTDNHRQETYVEVFTAHARQQPQDATLHYVCDNLAAHSTELFCRSVAELSGIPYPALPTAVQRRQWLESEDKRIVIHFTPLHGSWLNQVELWFGILKNKALKGRSTESTDELAQVILDFTQTWDEHFAHPFRWTYTGEGLAEKVVSRLVGWLSLRRKEMTRKFLAKQLQLMINLVQGYWSQVPLRHWKAVNEALAATDDYLQQIIAGHAPTQCSLADLRSQLAGAIDNHSAACHPAMSHCQSTV